MPRQCPGWAWPSVTAHRSWVPCSQAGRGALRCLVLRPLPPKSHPGPFLSELMTTSSRTPSQVRARPWRWCLAHCQPLPRCCSSHPPTLLSASQCHQPWHNSRPPCRTYAWPIGMHYRPTIRGTCSQGSLAHRSIPCTPPSSPWTCVPSPSACRWPSQRSPGTALPPPMETATSAGATHSPQAVLTDRAPLGPTGGLGYLGRGRRHC